MSDESNPNGRVMPWESNTHTGIAMAIAAVISIPWCLFLCWIGLKLFRWLTQ